MINTNTYFSSPEWKVQVLLSFSDHLWSVTICKFVALLSLIVIHSPIVTSMFDCLRQSSRRFNPKPISFSLVEHLHSDRYMGWTGPVLWPPDFINSAWIIELSCITPWNFRANHRTLVWPSDFRVPLDCGVLQININIWPSCQEPPG